MELKLIPWVVSIGLLILGIIGNFMVHCEFENWYDSKLAKLASSECKNTKELQGAYSRDFPYSHCCKQQALIDPSGILNYMWLPENSTKNCRINSVQDYPDDDFATSEWRKSICRMKLLKVLPTNGITFNSVVEHLTRNYTDQNDVKRIIRDGNVACPEGDKESDPLKKMKRYITCFHRNEEKICHAPDSNATLSIQKQQKVFHQTKEDTAKLPGECSSSLPGIWNKKMYCCNGTSTPEPWTSLIPSAFYKLHETKDSIKCFDSIFSHMESQTTGKKFRIINCHRACLIYPVTFLKNASAPVIDWKFDRIFENMQLKKIFTKKVINYLKSKANEMKPTFKMTSLSKGRMLTNSLSFEEAVKRYSNSTDKREKIIYYCNYYDSLYRLILSAFGQYCSPNDLDSQRPLYMN